MGEIVITVTTRIHIDRAPEDVFAVVADQTNAPRWQSGLYEVRRVTPGPLRVGTEHVFARMFAGRRFESRNRFTHYEPDHFVQFEVPDGWMTGHASYRVEPAGRGTELTSSAQFRAHGPLRLATPLLARLFAADSRRDEATLKELLEQPTEAVA